MFLFSKIKLLQKNQPYFAILFTIYANIYLQYLQNIFCNICNILIIGNKGLERRQLDPAELVGYLVAK